MKKRFAALLLSIFLSNTFVLASGDVFQGHAEYSDEYSAGLDKEMYTGKTETLEKRDTIEMTV